MVVEDLSSSLHGQNSPPKRRLACVPHRMALAAKAHIFATTRACSPNTNLPVDKSNNKHHQTPREIKTLHLLFSRKASTMAGGKGKSSGGKSSGGKSGHDSGKKQQSHSSKAGLQVSIAQSSIQHHQRPRGWSGGFSTSGSMVDLSTASPRSVASSTSTTTKRTDKMDLASNAMRRRCSAEESVESAIQRLQLSTSFDALEMSTNPRHRSSTPATRRTRPRQPLISHIRVYAPAELQIC